MSIGFLPQNRETVLFAEWNESLSTTTMEYVKDRPVA
jgi:hypothetical protein